MAQPACSLRELILRLEADNGRHDVSEAIAGRIQQDPRGCFEALLQCARQFPHTMKDLCCMLSWEIFDQVFLLSQCADDDCTSSEKLLQDMTLLVQCSVKPREWELMIIEKLHQSCEASSFLLLLHGCKLHLAGSNNAQQVHKMLVLLLERTERVLSARMECGEGDERESTPSQVRILTSLLDFAASCVGNRCQSSFWTGFLLQMMLFVAKWSDTQDSTRLLAACAALVVETVEGDLLLLCNALHRERHRLLELYRCQPSTEPALTSLTSAWPNCKPDLSNSDQSGEDIPLPWSSFHSQSLESFNSTIQTGICNSITHDPGAIMPIDYCHAATQYRHYVHASTLPRPPTSCAAKEPVVSFLLPWTPVAIALVLQAVLCPSTPTPWSDKFRDHWLYCSAIILVQHESGEAPRVKELGLQAFCSIADFGNVQAVHASFVPAWAELSPPILATQRAKGWMLCCAAQSIDTLALCRAVIQGMSPRVLYLAMSPDGQTIVTGAGDETLRFWNVFPGPKNKGGLLTGQCALAPSPSDAR